MPVRRTRFVKASPEAAFALLRDFSRLPDYNPGVRMASVKPGPCRPGDTFTLRMGAGPARMRVRGEVLEVADRSVRLRMRSVVDALETRFVEGAPGGCVVGWEVSYTVPIWLGGRLADALLFSPMAVRNIDAELDGVRRILEGS